MSRLLLSCVLCGLAQSVDVSSDSFLDDLTRASRGAGLKGFFAAQEKMPIYVSRPNKIRARQEFVIVAQHAVGIYNDVFLREFCDDLAKEGYFCLLPDFFWRVWSEDIPTGFDMDISKMNIGAQLKSQKDAELLEDLQGAVEYAKVASPKRSARIAVVGFCMGGRISWLAATAKALSEDVKGVVAYHGGNIFKAYPENAGTAPGDNLKDLSCPVLGHFAGLDQNPSPADQERLYQEGKALGKQMEFYTYDGVKHGFSCKDSSAYDHEAAEEAWPRTTAFLKQVLADKKDEL